MLLQLINHEICGRELNKIEENQLLEKLDFYTDFIENGDIMIYFFSLVSFCPSILVVLVEEEPAHYLWFFLLILFWLSLTELLSSPSFSFMFFRSPRDWGPAYLGHLLRIPLRMKVLYNIHYRYFLLYIFITLLDVYYNLVLYCWMAWCREEFTCDVHDESNNLIVLPFYGCREGYSRAYVIVFSCGGCCQAEILLCLCGWTWVWFMYLNWDKPCRLIWIYYVFGWVTKCKGDAVKIFKKL